MSASSSLPMLRLVSARVALTPQQSPGGNPPRSLHEHAPGELPLPGAQFLPAQRVARENAAAARLDPTDARMLFARETARRLEGDSQAILRPQRRRDLHALATRVGLRPFDANLVIAIVQDAARHDEETTSPAVCSRLSLLGAPRVRPASVLAQSLVALALGIIGFALLTAWLLGGSPG